MAGFYGETYLGGLDEMIYWVKEADDDYFLKNSVGCLFSIRDYG